MVLTHDDLIAHLSELRLDPGGASLGEAYVTGAVVLLTTRWPDGMDGVMLVNSEGMGGFTVVGVLHAALDSVGGDSR